VKHPAPFFRQTVELAQLLWRKCGWLLDEKILGGIGLDVYPEESALADRLRAGQDVNTPIGQTILSLLKSDRALFTPHNAFNTTEALTQKASLSAASVANYLGEGKFIYPVPAA